MIIGNSVKIENYFKERKVWHERKNTANASFVAKK